jgi:hypothetical protein
MLRLELGSILMAHGLDEIKTRLEASDCEIFGGTMASKETIFPLGVITSCVEHSFVNGRYHIVLTLETFGLV